MTPSHDAARWKALQSQSHRPEIQVLIQEAIRKASIRVIPAPSGGICILPLRPLGKPDQAKERATRWPPESFG
jgi:hypothetical protein